MSEFKVQFTGNDELDVIQPSTGYRWSFVVLRKGPGRRTLDGPTATPAAAAADGNLMQAACEFARAQALAAGCIDR